MTTETKAALHQLVDELPDDEIHTAQRFLEYLTLGVVAAAAAEPGRAPGIEQPTPDELKIRDAIDRAAQASRREIKERSTASDIDDPVLRAFMDAPEDDEPLTDEDLAAIAEGKADIDRGDVVRWEDYDPDRRQARG